MRAGVLHAGWFGFARPATAQEQERRIRVERIRPRTTSWDVERFADEQIRNLVCRVFDESATPPVRQIVLAAIDPELEIQALAEKIAEALASKTTEDVAIITQQPGNRVSSRHCDSPLRKTAFQVQTNVWLLSLGDNHDEKSGTDSLQRYLDNVRRQFQYSMIMALPGSLNDAIAAGRLADGAVMVLSAMRTRRASASRFLSALSGVRMLGTVLIDRDFPIPEAIYRRL